MNESGSGSKKTLGPSQAYALDIYIASSVRKYGTAAASARHGRPFERDNLNRV